LYNRGKEALKTERRKNRGTMEPKKCGWEPQSYGFFKNPLQLGEMARLEKANNRVPPGRESKTNSGIAAL